LKAISEYLTEDSRHSRQRIGVLFLLIALAFGAVHVYSCRYQLSPDGMDYLDIAREVAAGHWGAVANGYWGTLYSVLLSPLFLFQISPSLELPLAHLFSLLILAASFFCFRMFLHSCLDALNTSVARTGDDTRSPLPEPALLALGYALFLWSSLALISVAELGPDLLVSAVVYLAAAMLLRLEREARFLNFVVFGIILAVGYWAKAVMFPLGILFLGISFLKVREWKRNLVSATVFAIVAVPLIAALSLPRGRFTFGDSGVLNYATYVSPGGRVIHWQGVPPGSGTPKHATRIIALHPPIYEFNAPIAGTYPPSYDPSYWNEGHRSTFKLRAQMAAVFTNILALVELLLLGQPSLLALFLFFLLWSADGFPPALARWWQLLTGSLAIIGLYLLVHVEGRYIAGALVLLWLSLFCALRLPADGNSRRIAAVAVLGAVAAMLLSFSRDIAKPFFHGCPESAQMHIAVGQQLNLPPGTPVAVIGAGNFSYWAHLSRVRIVAEIMAIDEADFWQASAPERERILAAFRSTGARWVVAQPPAVVPPASIASWERVGAYYRYSLAEPRTQPVSAAQSQPPAEHP
jgi:hypothetical protein